MGLGTHPPGAILTVVFIQPALLEEVAHTLLSMQLLETLSQVATQILFESKLCIVQHSSADGTGVLGKSGQRQSTRHANKAALHCSVGPQPCAQPAWSHWHPNRWRLQHTAAP